MDAHLDHFHHQNCFSRFGRVGWNSGWCKLTNDATKLWLRLKNLSNCILHPSYTQVKVFEHLLLWWMGIWMHSYMVTTTSVAPDLGELLEIMGDICSNDATLLWWGCRTLQTASHIYLICILVLWAPSLVLHGHMYAHLHSYCHKCSSSSGRVDWNCGRCKCSNDATTLWLRL